MHRFVVTLVYVYHLCVLKTLLRVQSFRTEIVLQLLNGSSRKKGDGSSFRSCACIPFPFDLTVIRGRRRIKYCMKCTYTRIHVVNFFF